MSVFSQNNLEKDVQNHSPWFQTILQNYSNQNSLEMAQKQKYISPQQESPERNLHLYGQLMYNKGGINIQ